MKIDWSTRLHANLSTLCKFANIGEISTRHRQSKLQNWKNMTNNPTKVEGTGNIEDQVEEVCCSVSVV